MKYQILPLQDFTVLKNDMVKDASYFVLCQLEDSLGGANHAITIHNNMIFDGNEEVPLASNKPNLDHCCESLGNGDVTWKKVYKAYRYSNIM